MVSKLEGTELIEPKTSTDEHKLILWFVLYGRPLPQVWFKATGHFFSGKVVFIPESFPRGTSRVPSIVTYGRCLRKQESSPLTFFTCSDFDHREGSGSHWKNETTAA